jgi:hypothetical protein
MRVPTSFHALAALTVCAAAARAQAVVVYVDIDDKITGVLPVNLDFDGDGAVDFFLFRSEEVGVSVAGARDNRVLGPTPTSAFVAYLVEGTDIDDAGPYATSGFLARLFCESEGCTWFGPFTQVTEPGYIGVEFLIDEMTHFGWIRVGVSRVNGVATIFDFAYETQPDTPIMAGELPAPGGAMMLAGLVALRRRRR